MVCGDIMVTDNFEKSSVFGKGIRPSAKFQKNDKLRRNIYFEIRKLNHTLHTNKRDSRYARTIEQFIDAMIPSKVAEDPGKLPVLAKRSVAPIKNKVLCVFYLVSCLVQSYWAYLKDESEDNLAATEQGLEVLKHINEHYDQMNVIGDVRKGYILKS